MSTELLTVLLFGSLLVVLLTGLPLAFTLGSIAVIFTVFLWSPKGLLMIAAKTFAGMNYFILVAIPMFIFMGLILERSGIADDLYKTMHRWIGSLKGGLAMGTVLICTLFAAMTGISGAATVTMGVVALPAMLKRKYDKHIVVGSIAAGGALGILIPPSVTMIALALFAKVSVGKLFIGGVFPGLLLSFLFIIYIWVKCAFRPELGPSVPPEERVGWGEKFVALRSVILPIIIIFMVLGSIFSGAASPTEASAVGALGSLISAAVYRKLNWQNFKEACYRTLSLTCTIQWIMFGAMAFTAVYTAIGAPELIEELMMKIPGGHWSAIIVMQLTFFILGMFIDPMGIIVITTPIFFPIVRALGFDPVWFGILFVVNMEMAFLTPPFGYNLFYMKSVVPRDITLGDIYRSIIPFVALQALGLATIMIFPQIALFLPNLVFGRTG